MYREYCVISVKPPHAILLAAGRGTRMGDEGRAKVLYEVAGRPMIQWVIKACQDAGVERCVVIVGYQGEEVQAACESMGGCEFAWQHEQNGTGHAALMAAPLFQNHENSDDYDDREVFVLCGDGPLIRSATLTTLLNTHRTTQASATMATAVLDDPTGYGRVLRNSTGGFDRIVEQKDATPEQLAICEINPSYYCFGVKELFTTLGKVSNTNAQGEYYLTDVPGLLAEAGRTVSVVDAVPPSDVLGINTTEQLAIVDAEMRSRLAQANTASKSPSSSTGSPTPTSRSTG